MDTLYDIELAGVGYFLASDQDQDRAITWTWGPAELARDVAKTRDVPLLWDDFSGGMGYSERLMLGTYGWAINGHTRTPRLFLPGPYQWPVTLPGGATQPITDLIEFEGDLLLLAGRYVLRSAGGISDSLLIERDLGAGFVGKSFAVFRDSSGVATLYVGGTGGRFHRRRSGTWSQAADPSPAVPALQFSHLRVVYNSNNGGNGWRLYAVDAVDPSKIWINAKDPFTAGDWSASGGVTDGSPVRSLASTRRMLYYVADDGVYQVDEVGYVANLTPELEEWASSLNGQGSSVFNGSVWSTHRQGLYRTQVGNGLRQDLSGLASPGVGLTNETPIFGKGCDVTVEGGWIVLAQFNGTDSHISYGMERSVTNINGPGLMQWHGSEITIPGKEVTRVKVTNLSGYPRMWIAYKDRVTGAPGVVWCTIAEGDPLQDWVNGGKHRFAEYCALYLPAADWDNSSARKNLVRFDIHSGDLGTVDGETVKLVLSAAADRGAWVEQGSVAGSPRASIYPPGNFIEGYRLSTRIEGYGYTTGYGPLTATYPPILYALQARAGLVVEQKKIWRYRVKLGGASMRSGIQDMRDQEALLRHLESLQEAGYVPMKTELGEDKMVKVEAGISGIVLSDPQTNPREQIVDVLLSFAAEPEEQVVSVLPSPATGWRYDSEETMYDDIAEYN